VDSLAAVLKRDRVIVGAGVILVTALAWWYTVGAAREMGEVTMPMGGIDPDKWAARSLLPLFVMWMVMMVAMMLPTATPMILTFALVARNRRQRQRPYVPVAVFASGYLAVWAAFSAAAAAAQWLLHRAALLSPMMVSSSALLGGVLLLLAGIFQFSPLKRTCPTRCRAPLEFITAHWREGWGGAFLMGLEHGLFCTGCCWALMALLFVLGIMNLLWIAILTVLVGLEKILPRRIFLSRGTGVLLTLWGLWVLLRA
jgi:predicted metal-binding membrane protein